MHDDPIESRSGTASPRWTWWVFAIWVFFSILAIGNWQVEDVIAGTVCINPVSAQWKIFK